MSELKNTYDRLHGELAALRARLADAQREVELSRTDYDAACRTLVADEANEEIAKRTPSLREGLQLAESKFHGIELLIADKDIEVRAAFNRFSGELLLENRAREERELQEKRERLTKACRQARDRRDAMLEETNAAKLIADERKAEFVAAENALARHQEIDVDPFATEEETTSTVAHNAKRKELEAAILTARDARNKAGALYASLRAQYLETCGEFVHACDVLRWNCPPEKPQQASAA